MDRMLATSLDRLQTDRIDYYLMHSITSLTDWNRMKALGVIDFIERIRASGKVRHIGFSAHSNLHDFKEVVDDYPWDFCQIQYNYLDENFQVGKSGLEYAAGKGLGIVIMEPLRGGMLINKMPPQAKKIFDAYTGGDDAYTDGGGAKRSPAEWGLRWVWNHPEVHVVLSGMNEDAHVAENVRIASDARAGALTDNDLTMIGKVVDVFNDVIKVNCTGCAYCMPCPHGVNIPQCFAQYNSHAMFGGLNPLVMYTFYTVATRGNPSAQASACRKCGVCEKKCPQRLPIMSSLDDVASALEKPWVELPTRLVMKFMGR
jgi:predicted aldo/keto reductase-like oxidoreductase